MLTYQKGNLFDAPKGAILTHACNAQGVWGSGIAAEFKKRYPTSYKEYRDFCFRQEKKSQGMAFVTSEKVGCLITSENFGRQVDSVEKVLAQTEAAIFRLYWGYIHYEDVPIEIHSNKFNSGLFGVPWEQTEAVILNAMKRFDRLYWTVWEYD